MSLITLFSRPLIVNYKSSILSQATLFTLISWIINILYPWIIVYQTDGLWKKVDYFWEKPEIHFKYDCIMLIKLRNMTTIPSDQIVWTSFPQFNNQLDQKMIRVPFITNHEDDLDLDGNYDKLTMQLVLPLEEKEKISSIKLILFFTYELKVNIDLKMDSQIILESFTDNQASKLSIVGDIKFNQKLPLPNHKLLFKSNSIFDYTDSNDLIQSSIDKMLTASQSQIFSTSMKSNSLYLWTDGSNRGENKFTIDVNLNYSDDLFHYTPGFWNTIKWAWIQYFSIYIVVYWIIQKIRLFVFHNQITSTMVITETKSHGD
ncbi:transmembrane protein 231-like [Panonychus citri]|uniref:transmembrane protein 231-like n=1 Tax=Panonychus citri TaxID=50023 RepID=UPI0023082847|nr:transmembrane protein 231-like [Panonychus citri]